VIEDDGRGFTDSGDVSDGIGLLGMEERIGLVGGSFAVESTAGVGTTIAVEVPAE
jgi:signal transduction histidine kinase